MSGGAIAKRTDSSDSESAIQHIDKGREMTNYVELSIISVADLQRIRAERPAGASRRVKAEVLDRIRRAGNDGVPYSHSSHYFAFMLAHLTDEAVLPDRDWELSKDLYEIRGRLTDVLPRTGVVLDALHPEQYDVLELRREFHGGGRLSDPRAGEALLDAIRVLRENFQRTDEDTALVVAF